MSMFNREKELMGISGSGIEYKRMRGEDVVVVEVENGMIDSERKG